MASARERRVGAFAIALVVAALAVWRVAYVLAGPDPDTDAYGHYVIARAILEHPCDLTAHWVWLPLFHYLEAGAVLVGATLQSVRLFNVVVSAATPLVLYAFLRERRDRGDRRNRQGQASVATWDPSAALAATVAALNPIAMQMGTTGQTEPLFALLVLGGVWAWTSREPGAAGLLFGIAALLRYEAWAIPSTVLAVLALERVLGRWSGSSVARRENRAWLAAAVPALMIGAWIVIRRAHDGRWLVFLEETRAFAHGALGTKSAWGTGRMAQVAHDVRFYAVEIAWRCIGFPLVLAPFGLVRTLRTEGVRFLAIYAALLACITVSWLMRSQLGLERHFVVVVPFYATCIANGVVAIGDVLDAVVRRSVRANIHAFLASGAVRAAAIAGLTFATLGTGWALLDRWMVDWRRTSEQAWPDRRAVAAFLRTRSPQAMVFCDEATVEVLSGLDRRRVDRRVVDDPLVNADIAVAARAGREVYVATWASKVARVRGALVPPLAGEIAFRPPTEGGEEAGMVVLRVAQP